MKFISIRELRNSTNNLKKMLKKNGKLLLTSNGKPIALMTPVNEGNLEQNLESIRRDEARIALNMLHQESRKKGLDKLTMKQIDKIISEYRKSRKGPKTGE